MRTGGRYFQERSYRVLQRGKKFATELYVDCGHVKTLLSKSAKLAKAKGEAHMLDYYDF